MSTWSYSELKGLLEELIFKKIIFFMRKKVIEVVSEVCSMNKIVLSQRHCDEGLSDFGTVQLFSDDEKKGDALMTIIDNW